MRDDPRAFLIYSLALRITDGGKSEFYVSQRQLTKYFGWDIKTVRNAFRALREGGLFKLLREGRGSEGGLKFAGVYSVVPHSKLGMKDKCKPVNAAPLQMQYTEGMGEDFPQGGGGTGGRDGGKVGTLVSDVVSEESTSPSFASLTPDLPDFPAAPGKPKTNPKELPENFQPDISNQQLAKRNGLNLEEETATFMDLHGAIGNERSNWQSVFCQHLKDASWHRGRIAVPDWMPSKEWTGYLDMRERIGKVASQPAQKVAVRILSELRDKGQNLAAVLDHTIRNEWTSPQPVQ